MSSIQEKWVLVADWALAAGASLYNSLASGNALISDTQIDNSTTLAMFMDVSFSLGSVTTGSGSPYIGVYLYPLNQDLTTYGDGRFGSSATGPAAYEYLVGTCSLPASTTTVLTGMVRGITLPPGKFKVLVHNAAGVNLASSANTVKYRTYNRVISPS